MCATSTAQAVNTIGQGGARQSVKHGQPVSGVIAVCGGAGEVCHRLALARGRIGEADLRGPAGGVDPWASSGAVGAHAPVEKNASAVLESSRFMLSY